MTANCRLKVGFKENLPARTGVKERNDSPQMPRSRIPQVPKVPFPGHRYPRKPVDMGRVEGEGGTTGTQIQEEQNFEVKSQQLASDGPVWEAW